MSQYSKNGAPSYVSSPAWSLNSLTSTSSGGSTAPFTPHLGSVDLPPTPRSSASGSSYSPSTPGAPYMSTVPLPGSHALPTPPHSPQATRQQLRFHPLLETHRKPTMKFDVRGATSYITGVHAQALQEAASSPAVTRIVLAVPGIMWSFEASSPRGLTVANVLDAISQNLSYPVNEREHAAHHKSVQQLAAGAHRARTATSRAGDGLRRFDYLGARIYFAGLSFGRANDGSDVCYVNLCERVDV